jgi:uncharacterized protein YggE
MRPTRPLRPAAALAALCLLTAFANPLRAEDKPMDRLITVSASGYATAEPDQARLSTGVTSEADTAKAALAANSELMQKVIAGLKEKGVDAKDIQTGNFSVEPRYTQGKTTTPTIDGYRVTNQVEILVRDLKSLGGLLDALVTLGANQMHGLAFEVSKAETLKDEARKEAVANARRRAELLATAAGASIGEVVTIAEDVSYQGPRPMAMSARTKAEIVPIESGTETLEARVTVTWKLK